MKFGLFPIGRGQWVINCSMPCDAVQRQGRKSFKKVTGPLKLKPIWRILPVLWGLILL